MARSIVNNFRYGETSELLAGRIDTEIYAQGASRVENMIALKQGGLKRRPPMKFLKDVTDLDIKWTIPFTLNVGQSFVLLMSNFAMYVGEWKKVGSIEKFELLKSVKESTGEESVLCIPYINAKTEEFESKDNIKVNNPIQEKIESYEDDEFKEIRYAQYYDSMYIVHKNHPVLRVDYSTVSRKFSLTLPRILVNQNIEYKLSDDEIKKGYKVALELGWDDYSATELNTPPNNDGKKNYPSVVNVIGDQLILASTEAHPDFIWKSRSLGASQVIDKSENKSVQDFVQFQLLVDDEQGIKDISDLPMTVSLDENGHEVLQYDTYLYPLYRIPRGIEVSETTTEIDNVEIAGMIINNRFMAIRDGEDDNGFPRYIAPNGTVLYNNIKKYVWRDSDDEEHSFDYVEGIYLDYLFEHCLFRTIKMENGRPMTLGDNTLDILDGLQKFYTYTVPLYSEYSTGGTFISKMWLSSYKRDLTFRGVTIKCDYIFSEGIIPVGGEYPEFYPSFVDNEGELEITPQLFPPTSITVTGWQSTKNEDVVFNDYQVSGSRPTNPRVGDSYVVYDNLRNSSTKIYERTLHEYKGSFTKTMSCQWSDVIKRNLGIDDSFLHLDFNNEMHIVSTYEEGVETYDDFFTISVGYYSEKGGSIFSGGSWSRSGNKFDLYQYKGDWVNTVDYPEYAYNAEVKDDKKPEEKRDASYYTYKFHEQIKVGRFMYDETIWYYSNNIQKESVFSGLPSEIFPLESDLKFTDGVIVINNSTTYTATSELPIYYKARDNSYSFYQSDINIITFTYTDGIWTINRQSYQNIHLTSGDFEALIPVAVDGKVIRYVLQDSNDILVEADAYETVDLTKTSELYNLVKNVTKTSSTSTGMEFSLATGRSDAITWIGICERIIAGTKNSEWTLPISMNPQDVDANKYSSYGSELGFCVELNSDLIFLQRNNIARLMYRDYYGIHSIDLSITNPEILNGNIINVVAKQTRNPTIFFLKDDGSITTICVDRDNQIQAWTRILCKYGIIKCMSVVENESTQTLLTLCRQNVQGVEKTYIAYFDDDEYSTFKDCSFKVEVTADETKQFKVYYVKESNGGFRIATDEDYDSEMIQTTRELEDLPDNETMFEYVNDEYSPIYFSKVDEVFYREDGTEKETTNYPEGFYEKVLNFTDGTTYYEANFYDNLDEYTSLVTTNAYEAQSQDGSVTIGQKKNINKIIIRALDTGRVSVYTDSSNVNETLYTVSKDKEGLGDFEINIAGGASKDSRITVESIGGEPMTLLALAYDVKVMTNGR